nr:hypothetical protein [Bacteroidota bacterium]
MLKPKIILRSNLNFAGMALWPFIFLHRDHAENKTLLNHELIHIRQQLELLIVPFFLIYILHYSINLLLYRNHHKAYRNICFEREAYANEADMNYIANRNWFGFIIYLKK